MRLRQSKTDFKYAQAATEVAIFGAILIFLMGTIIRSAVGSGYNQNQSLKAMRVALLKSLESSKAGRTERNTSSILYIEDRLAPDFNKYGAIDRSPHIFYSGGTFSYNLFLPVDIINTGEGYDLEPGSVPVLDVFINGQYFIFTTARFVRVTNINSTGFTRNDVRVNWPTYLSDIEWDEGCICGADGTPIGGCRLWYQQIPNVPPDFCADSCPGLLTVDQRFDLDRDGRFAADPKGVQRQEIAWQWHAVRGLVRNIDIDTENGRYPLWDFDADFKEEVIYKIDSDPNGVITGVWALDYQEGDLDFSRGDRDKANYLLEHAGENEFEPRAEIGLQNEMSIFTYIRDREGLADGTYLEIKEGKLYNPESGEFVRSVSKKDTLDIIQRIFKLSADTDRFCGEAISSRVPGSRVATVGGLPNPVEVCVDSIKIPAQNCFTTANVYRTCFDEGTLTLFIRSRIADQRGRKWITDIERVGGTP